MGNRLLRISKRKIRLFIIFSLIIASIIMARYYFFYIGECFSDMCRHSLKLSVNEESNRVEFLPFFLQENYPFLFYTFDLPFLFLALLSKSMTNFNRVGLFVWGIQPSYDILLLIALALFFSFYRLKIISLLISLWVKIEVTILIISATYSYWAPLARFKIKGHPQLILVLCFLGLVFASVVNLTLVSGPENGMFQGSGNTIVRFLGYLAMPISSIISYDMGESIFANLIRIQTIILSLLFIFKCKNINFLMVYIVGCTGMAIIINFYQLRYVLTFIFAYSLFIGAKKMKMTSKSIKGD